MGQRGPNNERLPFFVRHAMQPSTGCRIWPFSLAGGYGAIRVGGKVVRINALICEAWHGERPPGAQAAHSCGNPACWAGEHLRWASPQENMADKVTDGTLVRGERHGGAKLTEADVLAIRLRHSQGDTATALAREYGVTVACASQIVRRLSWKHI
jgi:hypothetical protein